MNDHTRKAVGVDVSKAHLDVCRLPGGEGRRFANDAKGFEELAAWVGGRTWWSNQQRGSPNDHLQWILPGGFVAVAAEPGQPPKPSFNQPLSRAVREDLRDLEKVREILVELLVDALPSRVGSPLSIRCLIERGSASGAPNHAALAGHLREPYVCFPIPRSTHHASAPARSWRW